MNSLSSSSTGEYSLEVIGEEATVDCKVASLELHALHLTDTTDPSSIRIHPTGDIDPHSANRP